MSRTLFWYVFLDLLRIFGLTVGALAGVMSFGGLLRPLTQHGLDASQMAAVLYYFMPAMSTYSLPIAALFATTMVYGRLSADNEITAMRAGGISHLAIAFPAVMLGAIVFSISAFFLLYVVPVFTLKVEQVVYSNMARIVASQIEQSHEIKLGDISVFARGAQIPTPDPAHPDEQRVILDGPAFKTYLRRDSENPKVRVPEDFWFARRATAFISQLNNEVSVNIRLEGGVKFSREPRGAVEAGIAQTWIGPIPVPSPIKENTKFMDIARLHELMKDPARSARVQAELSSSVRAEQESSYLRTIAQTLHTGDGTFVFTGGSETYLLSIGDADLDPRRHQILASSRGGGRSIRLTQEKDGRSTLRAEAGKLTMRVRADNVNERFVVVVLLEDVATTSGDITATRDRFPRDFSVPMPSEQTQIRALPIEHFLNSPGISAEDRRQLARELVIIGNDVVSEVHGRASFAVSCLILVLVGCALGMMFKSGNFLSAFAISVIPAMLCIVLIVSGQHVAQNVPALPTAVNNPLGLGIMLIWCGNIVVAGIAFTLLWRLQRK